MYLSNDQFVTRTKYQDENDNTFQLDYFLKIFDTDNGETFYGLRIDKSTPDGVLLEREETYAISDNRQDVLVMAQAFAKGSVPPLTLIEMVDDWHSETEILPCAATG